MGVGRNAVFWNGRDEDDQVIPDGAYLVLVRGAGVHLTKPIAIIQ
jgi:hypothetical protein